MTGRWYIKKEDQVVVQQKPGLTRKTLSYIGSTEQ